MIHSFSIHDSLQIKLYSTCFIAHIVMIKLVFKLAKIDTDYDAGSDSNTTTITA